MAKLYPFQEAIINAMTQYKGRGLIQITGRNIGKSRVAAYKRLIDDIWWSPVQDLVLSEGKVYGSRYYTVEPVGGNWLEMESWATKTFGPVSDVWDLGKKKAPEPSCRWYMNDRKFWFRNEKDRDWFILRWRS